jgi:hypothetical protein
MSRTTLFACVLVSLATPACAVELTDAGKMVNVGKAEPQSGCKDLGTVYGTGSGGGYTSSEDKMRSARNDIRNNAAERGANYVSLDALGSDVSGMTLSGKAYACDEAPSSDHSVTRRPAPVPVAAPSATPEERLAKLKDLLDKGLITQDEYDKRRAQILQSL